MSFVRLLVLSLSLMLCGTFCPAQTAPAVKSKPPANRASDKASAAKGAKAGSATPAGALIDLNSASAAELKTLPGIGDAYSAAIVKNRPYANKTQLKSRNVIPPGTYEKIKDKVIAKQ